MSNFVNLLNVVYPVNSIYLSYSKTSPSAIVGGTWQQITGRYLRANNDVATGGSATSSHSHGDNNTLFALIGAVQSNTSSIGYSAGVVHPSGKTYNMAITGSVLAASKEVTANHTTCVKGTTGSASVSLTPLYQDLYVWRRTA